MLTSGGRQTTSSWIQVRFYNSSSKIFIKLCQLSQNGIPFDKFKLVEFVHQVSFMRLLVGDNFLNFYIHRVV